VDFPILNGERYNLKEMMASRGDRIIIAVGVSSGFEAKLLYKTICQLYEENKIPDYIGGFVTFVSGYLCAAHYGLPDLGFILREQIVRHTTVIEQATWMAALGGPMPALPIGVDIDTGYGNEPFSTVLTCRGVHRAGGQYAQIEDQYSINKSCGHMAGGHGAGKEVISKDEMVNLRVKPAVQFASTVDDLTIMVRTDAIAVEGFESGIDRMHAYEEAGAGILFVEAPDSEEQMKKVVRAFKDSKAVTMANMVEGSSHTPFKTPRELHEIGFGMGLYVLGGLLSSRYAQQRYYETLATNGNTLKEIGGTEGEWFGDVSSICGREQAESINISFHNMLK